MALVKNIIHIFYITWWITYNVDTAFLNIFDSIANYTGFPKLSNIDIIDPVVKKLVYERVYFIIFDNNTPDGLTYQFNDHNKILMDIKKPTKILIHGWTNDQYSRMPTTLKQRYLANISNLNIIIVDWSGISKIIVYSLPANETTIVGECVADFLLTLYGNTANRNIDVHFIGHSLGAHVSGFAGRKLRLNNYLAYRITGLDPANPLIENGLSSTDANFVDVIHTSSGTLGKAAPLGHADFYPNGGTVPQPGCIIGFTPILTCSHSRSWEYYARTIANPHQYLAYRCSSYSNFLVNRCDDTAYMGEGASTAARGVYYINASL